MKFLNIDSPFMQVMNKVADLMILNLLTVVCMIPFSPQAQPSRPCITRC